MSPAIPMLLLRHVHQPDVRFVDQRGGIERLTRFLLGELLRRQRSQLIVDQGQELLSRLRVTLFDGVQYAGHVTHGTKNNIVRSDQPHTGCYSRSIAALRAFLWIGFNGRLPDASTLTSGLNATP